MQRLLLGVLAMVILAGLAAGAAGPSGSPSIPVYLERNAAAPRFLPSIPAALGLLAPQVANYTCRGGYQPAAEVRITPLTPISERELPFWQFGIACARRAAALASGEMLPGVVGIAELPTAQRSLRSAIRFLTSANHLRLGAAGTLPVGVGRIQWAPGNAGDVHLVWFIGGATAYWGVGRLYHRRVLVYLMGRDVPVATLKAFAHSMRPLVQ